MTLNLYWYLIGGMVSWKKIFFSFRKCAFTCWLHHFLTTWPWENHSGFYICSVQFSHSVVSDSLWRHGLQHARFSCPSPTPRVTQIHVHQVSDAIQPSHPLSSPSPLPSIFPSIRVFSNESVLLTRWPKYWSFSFSISPSNEHPGLISFRMDWLDLFLSKELSRVFFNTTLQ